MDSGSDTETDDELFERLEQLNSAPVDAPASPLRSAVTLMVEDGAVAATDPVPSIAETEAAQPEDQANTVPETPVAQPQTPLPVASSTSSARFVDSDDDEPPRMPATAPAASVPDAVPPRSSTLNNTVRTIALPSLSIFAPKTQPPVQIGTSTSVAVAAAAARAASKREQLVTQHHTAVASPPSTQHHSIKAPSAVAAAPSTPALQPPVPATVVMSAMLPSSSQFKSPFSSLATQYQPPPPPVVGAPPTSYVPLRAPPVYGGPSTSYVPVPPMHRTPTIPCVSCSRILPENASPIPLGGHGVCSCCGRYYPSLLIRQSQSFCTACVPTTSAASRPATSSSPAVATRVYPTCGTCMRQLNLYPPLEGKGKQCSCCRVWYAKHAFSKKQARSSNGKCGSCVTGHREPVITDVQLQKQHKLEKKKERALRRKAAQEKKQENAVRRKAEWMATQKKEREANNVSAKSAAVPTQTALSVSQAENAPASSQTPTDVALPPPEVSQASPQERQEMEVDVRNIKLARRSIHRRRQANDLRGSTRVEYEMQLGMEEDKLNQKMDRMRRRNPALYDWVNQNLEIKGALGIAPSERDHPVKAKKNQKQQQKKQKPKPKPREKPKSKPATQKRKESGGAKAAPSQAKRPRVAEASALPAQTRLVDTKPDMKGESSSGGAVSASSNTPRAVASRARRAKPIEIIDLVDSD